MQPENYGSKMGLQKDREKKLEDSGVTHKLAGGDVDESLRLVLENGISPYSVPAFQMRGMLCLRHADYANADTLTKQALQMRRDAISLKMLGDSAYLQTKYTEAEAYYRQALAEKPDAPEIMHDLAVSIVAQGRTAECLSFFERAVALAPNRPEFQHHYAIMLLLDGQIEAGWDRMQHRLNVPGVTGTFPYPEKYWKGEDVAGKTIVIRSEQGWGDTIMFSRYFQWFLKRGAKVYFYGQRALLSWVKNYFPDVIVWPNDAPVPIACDYHVNIMCLPRLCGLDVPAPQPRKEAGRGIGFCWFGSPTHKADHLRSVPVEMFAPLAEAADEKLYSLGYGYFWKMENGIAIGDNKPDFVEYCIADKHDWFETSEFMKTLDLVITVDTAIAHMAGFLGVETWLLLPYVPDFRWGMKGETTPWYPSMRLYRQPKLFDWDSVFERVSEDLRARVAPSRAEAA